MKKILSLLLISLIVTSLGFSQQEPGEGHEYYLDNNDSISHSINRKSNVIEYPYGYSQPVLKCAQLRYSRIILQEGEAINNIVVGDERRWSITKSWEGESGSTRPVILVKPRYDNASTNLLIFTNKRTYDITIEAHEVRDNSTNPNEFFTRAISFYYPDEGGQLAGSFPEPPVADSTEVENEVEIKSENHEAGVISLADVNLHYDVKEGRYGFPWKPETVYDNGVHTFLKLPKTVEAAALPSFYVLSETGRRQNVNIAFNPNSRIIKIDRVFKEAVLVYSFETKGFLGFGTVNREKELLITRKSNQTGQ